MQLLFEIGRFNFCIHQERWGKKTTFEQTIIGKTVVQDNMQQFGLEAFHKHGESFTIPCRLAFVILINLLYDTARFQCFQKASHPGGKCGDQVFKLPLIFL